MVARRGSSGPDPVALVEIDLYGELMIAASSADEDRLSTDRIDEVLRVEADRSDPAERARVDSPRSDRGADRAPGAEQDSEAEVPDAG
ncbi:hypothetical protein [Streptomyces coffeae]|uniref:Uncharacterized protein n=1 Tax=Streptomyces coffeae TaxID=621382 RepID=A0ABS1NNF8_9ACTN|nr:hypothetical protein [Streptomyces coffeae]MBL1101631.1 hypothetical protein [Streptomyces coffeae]